MYAALLLLAACLPSGWMVDQKALDVYVKQYDPHYRYTLMKEEDKWGATVYTLNMTSLKWLNESELTNPIWWHELIIAVSKERKLKDSCLLIIGNGRNDASNTPTDSPTDLSVDELVNLAKSTGSCVALLGQIPNQPITYKTIPLQMCKNSIENAAVYCTWWKFMNDESEQPNGLIQFPMVKAAVRGMDTIIDFLLKESGGTVKITKFTLTGISKRGWATWLAAAVDKRVVSFIPIVYDLLNFVKNRHHQYRAYCGWGRSLNVFHELNLTRQLDSPRFKELTSYVDPFEYNERYQNKPKCLICGTGDGINPPDDSHYYFDQLAGVKYIRFLPNTTHHVASRPLDKASILETCRAIYLSTMQNLNMPQISWKRVETNSKGIIHLCTDQEPSATKCFFANTLDSKRRDFRRFPGHRVSWFPCEVEKVKTGVYKAEMTKPRIGWRAFFIEVTFLGSEEKKYVFTSEVHIIPDTFPCADCKGEECYGKLV
ncbi:autocrine proliferation repressor protein A-like [Lacerta agilis]|uniref:autocrine proliferation repressor protein A-like n=1 Tax=Lacerta agilis TaxID=80427 RepID=UPI00141A08D5|nr:autocrine proliferation repressor protein A-like [Lacerta agilis]